MINCRICSAITPALTARCCNPARKQKPLARPTCWHAKTFNARSETMPQHCNNLPNTEKNRTTPPGLIPLCLLLLNTGCASYQPMVSHRIEHQAPTPVPEKLTAPLPAPEIPPGRLSNETLLVIIADYHRTLTQANIDRQLTQEYCHHERSNPATTERPHSGSGPDQRRR